MFIVVSYDIPDDRRRNKVAQSLKGYGYRVQKSVFECEVSPELFEKMKKKLKSRINPEEDSLRYYQLCQECLKKIIIEGPGEVKREKPYFVV